MDKDVLRKIGLTENEIVIYLDLLRSGSSTAYDISKRTGIYRVHVYDKLEQLMDKGLATQVHKGAKKQFQPTPPGKLSQYLEEKKMEVESWEKEIGLIMPELEALTKLPREDTFVEVFKGKEGIKYVLKDIVKTKKDVLITGIDDERYHTELPVFMGQYFRDVKDCGIKERVITLRRKGIFIFDKKIAPNTEYRFLEEAQFNPTNTYVYGEKVVIVTWGTPVLAVMIKNDEVAKTYRNHFEYLWKIASKAPF
jgi:sugar-specific transcriptional regulator TrmB